LIVGIDLGTTNSLVAVWVDGHPQIIPNALGHNLTPSVVGVDKNGEFLVGLAARERLLTHPEQTAAIFKRHMGTNRVRRIGKHSLRPEELSSMVLRALKQDAETWLGEKVTEAIVTVPAYFSDAQRKATRAAGQLAGLKVERLLNEPTAAALAYGLHNRDIESKFLVFDLGGGTFDVSVLELFEGVMEVRASAGDNFLGGEDFVECLIDGFMATVGKPAGLPQKNSDPAFYQLLHDAAERAKRKLTIEDAATLGVNWKGQPFSWTVTTDDFAKLADPLLQRLRTPVERALRDARIRSAELNEVVLAGGATRKPLIRKLAARMFGRLPAAHLNPDEVVALGAAVQAGLQMSDAALNELVMTDVCPYTLGIEVAERSTPNGPLRGGMYLPIIERNTVVPTSRVKEVSTLTDGQQLVIVKIFQGESRYTKDNIVLGEIHVPVPPRRAGEVSVEVRFTYDLSGLLEVDVHIPMTGDRQQVVIEENPGVLSQEEIAGRLQKLGALKIHPRDDAVNRAVLARAERLYEQSLGQVREFVNAHTNAFLAVLETQDRGLVDAAREKLVVALDSIESDSYL
jgi:molecular chaperone HscC